MRQRMHTQPQRPVKRVLQLLHPPEEIGKVHNAGEIRFGEADAAALSELMSHVGRICGMARGMWQG